MCLRIINIADYDFAVANEKVLGSSRHQKVIQHKIFFKWQWRNKRNGNRQKWRK